MIVSHLWLSWRKEMTDPDEAFVGLVTNLETVTLRFRVQFVVSQAPGQSAGDATSILRNTVHLENERASFAPGSALSLQPAPADMTPWTRSGEFYHCSFDLVVRPGETARAGLRIALPLPSATPPTRIFNPGGFIRGHWALTLPAVSVPIRSPPAPQLDRPARVLLAAFRCFRRHQPDDIHDLTPFPLASGQAEHLITPDVGTTVKTRVGAARPAPKRARERAARRRGKLARRTR
jgi:hypothetical protein